MYQVKTDLQRTVIVCVDSYERGVLCGRLYTSGSPEGESFGSVMELLWKTEQYLNQRNFPEPFSKMRSFGNRRTEVDRSPPTLTSENGEIATFSVRVLFRQNADWQGAVEWLEGAQSESFRSVLELLFLIKSALEDAPSESPIKITRPILQAQ